MSSSSSSAIVPRQTSPLEWPDFLPDEMEVSESSSSPPAAAPRRISSFEGILGSIIYEYLPDEMENLTTVCKLFNESINSVREYNWSLLQTDPQMKLLITHCREINRYGLTIKQKMKALEKVFQDAGGLRRYVHYRLGDDPVRFQEISGELFPDNLLHYAIAHRENALFNAIDLRLIPKRRIQRCLEIAMEKKEDDKALRLLPSTESLSRTLKSAVEYKRKRIIQHLLAKKHFDVSDGLGAAAWAGSVPIVEMILRSGNPYTHHYSPQAGFNVPILSLGGLQEAILLSTMIGKIGALRKILKLSQPNREILEHARDFALFKRVYHRTQERFPNEAGSILVPAQPALLGDGRDAERVDLRNRLPERFNQWPISWGVDLNQNGATTSAIIALLNATLAERFGVAPINPPDFVDMAPVPVAPVIAAPQPVPAPVIAAGVSYSNLTSSKCFWCAVGLFQTLLGIALFRSRATQPDVIP